MKKKSFLVLVICVILASCKIAPKDVLTSSNLPTSTEVRVPEFKNSYVNDYGDLLTQGEEKPINRELRKYQDTTSTQIVVLTLASFDDQNNGPLFDYSKKVFSAWGIGQKNMNNGVLLVIVKNLATKNAPGIRIVTGYGIEGALPDITCKKIVESIRPLINEGKYEEGINLAITKMQMEVKSEFKVAKADDTKKADDTAKFFLIVLFVAVGCVALYYLYRFFFEDELEEEYHSSGLSYSSDSYRRIRRSIDDDTPYVASSIFSSGDSGYGSSNDSSDSSDCSCDCGGGDSGGGGGGD